MGSLKVKGQGHGRVGYSRVGTAGGIVAEHADLTIQCGGSALPSQLSETTQCRVTLCALL